MTVGVGGSAIGRVELSIAPHLHRLLGGRGRTRETVSTMVHAASLPAGPHRVVARLTFTKASGTRPRRLVPAAVFAFALFVPCACSATPAAVTTVLSNATTSTQWAHAQRTASIRVAPADAARSVDRVHYMTEDGRSEVYLVLRQRESASTM
jgi:hypothetical protein